MCLAVCCATISAAWSRAAKLGRRSLHTHLPAAQSRIHALVRCHQLSSYHHLPTAISHHLRPASTAQLISRYLESYVSEHHHADKEFGLSIARSHTEASDNEPTSRISSRHFEAIETFRVYIPHHRQLSALSSQCLLPQQPTLPLARQPPPPLRPRSPSKPSSSCSAKLQSANHPLSCASSRMTFKRTRSPRSALPS